LLFKENNVQRGGFRSLRILDRETATLKYRSLQQNFQGFDPMFKGKVFKIEEGDLAFTIEGHRERLFRWGELSKTMLDRINRINRIFQKTDYWLPITSLSPITDHLQTGRGLPSTRFTCSGQAVSVLPITDYRSPITDYRSLITDYRSPGFNQAK